MPGGETILDRVLALKQPVHRGVQIILVRALDTQLTGECRLPERADHPELRSRADHPARGSSPGTDPAPGTLERSNSLARSSRRAITSAAFTCPAGSDRSISNASRRHERLAGQHPPDRVDRLRREMREVRERLLLDLPVLPEGTPQQRRRILTLPRPARSRAHMHRTSLPRRTAHSRDPTASTGRYSSGYT